MVVTGRAATAPRLIRLQEHTLMSIEYTPGPLLEASRTTPTVLWNDSTDPDELRQSIDYEIGRASCRERV